MMYRTILSFFLFVLLLPPLSCTSVYGVHTNKTKLANATDLPPKPKDAKIDVYEEEESINRSYQKLYSIELKQTYAHQSYMKMINVGGKREARKVGADAIVVKERFETRMIVIAIRYTDEAKQKEN